MESHQRTSDEMELGQFFAKIADVLKKIGEGVIKFLAFLRNTPLQNRVLFISLVLIGGASGLIYSIKIKKKFYDSSMILSSDYLNKRIVESSIRNLNLLAEEETSDGLSVALHISDTLASNIVKFDARPFVAEKELVELEVLKEQLKSAQLKNQGVIDQITRRIEIENQHAFEFSVRTYNPTAIKPLQDALVNYFKNNDYIKKRIQINHDNLKAKREKLLRESLKLDSLKKVIYSNYKTMAEQSRQGSNNVILSDKAVTNPIELYSEDLKLYDQLQATERGIFLQPDFELIDGFTQFNEPASASRVKVIATAVLIAFILGYVFVVFSAVNKYLSTIR